MKGVKINFSDEQIAWLKENFADTLNGDICKYLGCGETTLRWLVKVYGLKKSEAHIERRKEKAKKMLRRYYLTHKPSRNVEQIVKYQFKKGNDPRTFKRYEDGLAKMKETRRQMIREEKARITFGLPQRTRMKLVHQPRAKVHQRYYLKKRGYIINEEEHVAYWTADTKRAPKIESRTRNYYKFKEYGLAI